MKKVLVAEDSSVLQNLIKKILGQSQEYHVVGVKNGKALLKELEKDEYNVILMDINMPQMDGIECTKEIRNHENALIAKTPIIAITGNALNYTAAEYKALGINEYLPKPIDFDALVGAVRRLA